jgi:ABC-2 type transport system permease protein
MTTIANPRLRSREGSPWTGLWAVVTKDMADHLTSARMYILELLILVTAVGTVGMAVQEMRKTTAPEEFVYLKLFTTAQDPMPAFIGFLAFLVPLVAIALTFDAINGEFNQRTLSRVLAQPIYRDALLMGKFLAGLFTMTLVLAAIWLLILGMGIIGLGVPPTGNEMTRLLFFLLVTIFYGGVWLALAMVFSVLFRQPATAALGSLSIWLFITIFWNMVVNMTVQALRPIRVGLPQEYLSQIKLGLALSRISPNTLFSEASVGLLQPSTRSLGLVLPSELNGMILGAPLPLRESILLIWPHLAGLIAATILLFALAYILFQRQEIRA